LSPRDLMRERTTVCAVGAHRVPAVAAGDDPRFERDLLAGETVGIAPAVPALVVRSYDRANLAHEAAHTLEHALPLDGVRLDQLPLARVERAGLVDDLLGDGDL